MLKPAPPEPFVQHPVTHCDRVLRTSDSFDRFTCNPLRFVCTCGRVWFHVCDEAEGCFYVMETEE